MDDEYVKDYASQSMVDHTEKSYDINKFVTNIIQLTFNLVIYRSIRMENRESTSKFFKS